MKGTLWRHKKGGIYYVLTVGYIESDYPSLAVVYHSIDSPDTVWIRPFSEFLDGRFTEIDESTFNV